MGTAKVTEKQPQALINCSALVLQRHSVFLLAFIIILIVRPISCNAESQLATDQVIQTLEQSFNGKVISIAIPDGDDFYQVRFLKSNAEVLLLKVDPVTAAVVGKKKVGTRNSKK